MSQVLSHRLLYFISFIFNLIHFNYLQATISTSLTYIFHWLCFSYTFFYFHFAFLHRCNLPLFSRVSLIIVIKAKTVWRKTFRREIIGKKRCKTSKKWVVLYFGMIKNYKYRAFFLTLLKYCSLFSIEFFLNGKFFFASKLFLFIIIIIFSENLMKTDSST